MNSDRITNPRSPSSTQVELPTETLPSAAPSGSWSGRLFYVGSALLHVAVAVALASSWQFGVAKSNAATEAIAEPAPQPVAARMAIDVGPIKFCEMKIESLIGQPRSSTAP